MAVHPLRPATYHRLGGPLPRQQANRTQSSPAASLFIARHMRAGNCIRCCQSFPSVIPVCRASSLRVTHPSALASLCKHSFAKDLHVLSILSAFILSQDQTLHSTISFHLFIYLYLYRCFFRLIFSSSFYSCLPLSSQLLPQLTKIILSNFTPPCQHLFCIFFINNSYRHFNLIILNR